MRARLALLVAAAVCLTACASKAPPSAEQRSSGSSPPAESVGTGRNYQGFRFDPRGADFTVWLNHAKNQVYRNWIVPQDALMGFEGSVEFEITFERDGSVSALRIRKSSGTASLDRAAHNAHTRSRFMPLPDDYGPPRVTMTVSFHCGPPKDE